jgi:hypothetical protein
LDYPTDGGGNRTGQPADNSIWEPTLRVSEKKILEIDAIAPDKQPAGGRMAAREEVQSGQGIAPPAALDLDGNQAAALAHDEVHLTVGLAPPRQFETRGLGTTQKVGANRRLD